MSRRFITPLVTITLMLSMTGCDQPQTAQEQSAQQPADAGQGQAASGSAPRGLRFIDVAHQAGLVHSGPTYTASVADVDADGWLDIAISKHGPLELFMNRGGHFEGLPLTRGDIHGLTWLDWNDDTLPDLYVSRGGNRGRGVGPGNALFINQAGTLQMQDIDGPARNSGGRGRAATPWDVDGDGRLDLFVMNFESAQRLVTGRDHSQDNAEAVGWRDMKAENLVVARLRESSPFSFLVTSNAGARILRPGHDGRLLDVGQRVGVDIPNNSGVAAVVPTDVDNDGDLDLYYVMTGLVNQGVRQVERRVYFKFVHSHGLRGGLTLKASGTITAAIFAEGLSRHRRGRFGDGETIESYPLEINLDDPRLAPPTGKPDNAEPGVTLWRDQQGMLRLDFLADPDQIQATTGWIEVPEGAFELVAVEGDPKRRVERANHLFINDNGRFTDGTEAAGLAAAGAGQDAVSADFDNDGDVDIYVLNGRDIFGNPPNMLFENRGGGQFLEVTAEAGAAGSALGRGASVLEFDYDRDGDLDLLITNGIGPAPGNDGPIQLLRNESATGNWLQVNLRTTRSNTMALGARLTLTSGESQQVRAVTAATGRASVSWRPVHFGMGEATRGTLTVEWPSGAHSEHAIQANRFITVEEPEI